MLKRLVNELMIKHRRESLCLGSSSLLFLGTSLLGVKSEIINVA